MYIGNNGQLMFATESLFPVLFAIHLMVGLLIFILFRKNKNLSVKYWVTACFLFCTGSFLIATRNYLPAFIGYSLANFLLIYSHYLCYRSIEYFNKGTYSNNTGIQLFCIAYALGYLLILNYQFTDFIGAYAGLFNFILQFWIFFKIYKMNSVASNPFSRALAYCYLATSLIWFTRMFLSSIYNFQMYGDHTFADWLTLSLITLCILLKHFMYGAMQLTQSNTDLERISELLAEREKLITLLEVEKIKADQANTAKSQFLANVSHEIRTPLHGLIGLVSIILKSPMSNDIRKSLDKVFFTSKALLLILNDILDFSKISSEKFQVVNEPFLLKNLFEDSFELFSNSATEKNIKLQFHIDKNMPQELIGDFYKLRQVIMNLLGNAIKFTNQGSIQVSAEVDRIEKDWVNLTIRIIDTGIGISEENLKSIYEPFHQIDNSNTRQYDGVGLGLPICQNILSHMDSHLNMRSQMNVGTEASFQLRLEINLNHSLSSPSKTTPLPDVNNPTLTAIANKKILVAEDNSINLDVIGRYLDYLNIRFTSVTNGQQCLEELQKNPYDLLLIDIQMPILDGIQATRKIRLLDAIKDLPIIGLSAGVSDKEQEICMQSGMNDFLGKPFEMEDLAQKLFKHLSPQDKP